MRVQLQRQHYGFPDRRRFGFRNLAPGAAWTPASFGSNLITWWRESGIQSSSGDLTSWNADAASATVRNLSDPEPNSDPPAVVTNGGENAVTFTRSPTLGQFVRLTGTTYDALTAGVIWAVWKHGTTLSTNQDLFSMGYASNSNYEFALRLFVSSGALYPGYAVADGSGNSSTHRLAFLSEENTGSNATQRQAPASTVCAVAIECDSSADTVRIFFANSTTMRTFNSYVDANDGNLIVQALAGTGARGDFISYMSQAKNRLAIGCRILNNDTNDNNFLDGTVFEVGIKSGTLSAAEETNLLAWLLARRALKS